MLFFTNMKFILKKKHKKPPDFSVVFTDFITCRIGRSTAGKLINLHFVQITFTSAYCI